jgi:hypothetical protein
LAKELRGNEKKYLTLNELRNDAFALTHEYRCLELIHRLTMQSFGGVFPVAQGLVGQFILFCNFYIILGWDTLGRIDRILLTLWTLSCTCSWLIILELSGRFYENAKQTLKSWKFMKFEDKLQGRYMKKFRKTCRPLKIGLDGYMKINRLAVLKFIRGITKGTFRALLTVGKKT